MNCMLCYFRCLCVVDRTSRRKSSIKQIKTTIIILFFRLERCLSGFLQRNLSCLWHSVVALQNLEKNGIKAVVRAKAAATRWYLRHRARKLASAANGLSTLYIASLYYVSDKI